MDVFCTLYYDAARALRSTWVWLINVSSRALMCMHMREQCVSFNCKTMQSLDCAFKPRPTVLLCCRATEFFHLANSLNGHMSAFVCEHVKQFFSLPQDLMIETEEAGVSEGQPSSSSSTESDCGKPG